MSRRSVASSGITFVTRRSAVPSYGVILAGGWGSRLWPLARREMPKQFLPLWGGKSLFRIALERIAPLVGMRRVLVVTAAGYSAWIRNQAPELKPDQIILEELGRNTAASVALAALWILKYGCDGPMIILPSDHWVEPVSQFRKTVSLGVKTVNEKDCLFTIGIRPRSVDPGFGYIRPADSGVRSKVRHVIDFIEKPLLPVATRLVRSRNYLWNSGIFVWRAGRIIDELREHAPGVIRALEPWARRTRTQKWNVPKRVLAKTPAIPIDRAVLERSRKIMVARASFHWSDLGNWLSLGAVMPVGKGWRSLVKCVDSRGCISYTDRGMIMLLGVENLVVVRSGEVTMVANREDVQRIGVAAERLTGSRRRYL